MKMHEKYRFFSLYVVQKSPNFFCMSLKNFANCNKKTLLWTTFYPVTTLVTTSITTTLVPTPGYYPSYNHPGYYPCYNRPAMHRLLL